MEEIEIVLGKGNIGNYCCTNISMADVFLQILPKLKEEYNAEAPTNSMFSNESSPAAVNFYEDDKLVATYKRDVIKTHFAKLTPFSDPVAIKTPVHNVITIYEKSFCDKVKTLSNNALDFCKLLNL